MKPTQEQILSALNKLIKENKTELKTEKVELGVIDDFEKLFNKSIDASVKIGTTFIDAVSKAQSKYKGNISDMEKALKIGTEIKKQAKELGLDVPKELDTAFEMVSKARGELGNGRSSKWFAALKSL